MEHRSSRKPGRRWSTAAPEKPGRRWSTAAPETQAAAGAPQLPKPRPPLEHRSSRKPGRRWSTAAPENQVAGAPQLKPGRRWKLPKAQPLKPKAVPAAGSWKAVTRASAQTETVSGDTTGKVASPRRERLKPRFSHPSPTPHTHIHNPTNQK